MKGDPVAYARFSSDNWKSDVYTWADVGGGWITHVASSRHVFDDAYPMPEYVADGTAEAFVEWYGAQRIAIDHAHLEPIGGPLDGSHCTSYSPGECAEFLLMVRSHGYHVPQYAIDALLEESL
jgi:hypothetical protein